MAQDGLLVIMFDEPSTVGNLDQAMYMVLAGKMLNSGAYPNQSGQREPICYPHKDQQNVYPQDMFGLYASTKCNHYNLLKLIEANWSLRGLDKKNTSAGYKYAFPLNQHIPGLWR